MRKVYILPFVVRIEVKLSMFHYKIIHNILCTKSLLLEERRLPTVPSLSSRSHHHSSFHWVREFYIFNEFVSLARDKISLEKYISCTTGREKDFRTKWSAFSSLLNTV